MTWRRNRTVDAVRDWSRVGFDEPIFGRRPRLCADCLRRAGSDRAAGADRIVREGSSTTHLLESAPGMLRVIRSRTSTAYTVAFGWTWCERALR